MTATRVLVADDHPTFRRGLRALIDSLPGIELAGEAADGEAAVAQAARLRPDVVVMDLNMPVLNGVEATRKIVAANPGIAVLVLTMLDEDEPVFAAMRAGARGYIVKGADTDDLLRALESVAHGDVVFGPAVAGRVLSYLTRPLSARDPVLFPELTDREREILELLARGMSNTQIARKLVVSPKTVRNHVSNIFTKLQVNDRTEAIRRAQAAGLVTAQIVPLRLAVVTAGEALAAAVGYLDRCPLAVNTVRAYRRQCGAYAAWLAAHGEGHPDAFTDVIGAEAAVTAWRRHLLQRRASPASINQALAAVTLLYEHGTGLRIRVKRARIERPGEPAALTPRQQGALERAAGRRGPRDAAIIAVLLYAGARAAECARLEVQDVPVTARTGAARLHGKGDQARTVPLPAPARERVSAWLLHRGSQPGPLWTGQRGPLSVSGITQAVLAAGAAAGIEGLRPHRLRHTYATRLRQGGADPAHIQALLGHGSLEPTARYFRVGAAEKAAVVERVFEQ